MSSSVSAASLVSKEVPCRRRIVALGNFSWKSSTDVAISNSSTNGILPSHELELVSYAIGK